MDNTSNILETAKKLGKSQKLIIKSLLQFNSSLPIEFFGSDKAAILNLQDKGFVEIKNDNVFLTSLGRQLWEEWQTLKNTERKISPEAEVRKEEKLAKSNQFLELYKQGLSYQGIADTAVCSQIEDNKESQKEVNNEAVFLGLARAGCQRD